MIKTVEKNKEYIVDIIDNGYEGEGIAKIENFTIFVPNTIKGEKVKILIVKVLTSHAFGKVIEILEESKYRVENDCSTYKRCGGCNLRHIEYEETLNMKQNSVQSLVNKTLKQKIEEARSKQAMLVARSQMADAKSQMAKTLGNMDSKSAFAKMDKMEQKIAAKEAQADAYSEVSGIQESENDPFAQMDKENSINAELEKLKQEMNKNN